MLGLSVPPTFDPPEEGQPAPDFRLLDARGSERQLREFAGRWLVLYFYPKDDTPGCTREACSFRDGMDEFLRREVHVIGISADAPSQHQQFIGRHGLPFPLLSDPRAVVAGRYGARGGLPGIRFAKRQTFLIDPEGIIRHVWRKVNWNGHAKQVLNMLDSLRGARG